MSDDKRSPGRVGKPLVYGEIIISEVIFAQYMKKALDDGFRAGIEAAAKVADKHASLAYKRGDTIIAGTAASIRDAVRALAKP